MQEVKRVQNTNIKNVLIYFLKNTIVKSKNNRFYFKRLTSEQIKIIKRNLLICYKNKCIDDFIEVTNLIMMLIHQIVV